MQLRLAMQEELQALVELEIKVIPLLILVGMSALARPAAVAAYRQAAMAASPLVDRATQGLWE